MANDDGNEVAPKPPQEWTLRLIAIAAVLGLTAIAVAVVRWPDATGYPGVATLLATVTTSLVTALASVTGIKGALSTPSPPKVQ